MDRGQDKLIKSVSESHSETKINFHAIRWAVNFPLQFWHKKKKKYKLLQPNEQSFDLKCIPRPLNEIHGISYYDVEETDSIPLHIA